MTSIPSSSRTKSAIDEWYNLSLTIQGDLGFADLTIAGGTHNRTIEYDIDSTAYMTAYKTNGLDLAEYYTGIREFLDYDTCYVTYGCYLFVNYNDFGADPTGLISLDQEVTSFVQEIRLVSKDDGSNKFNWLVGAFYEDTDNDWDYLSFRRRLRHQRRRRIDLHLLWRGTHPMTGLTRASGPTRPTTGSPAGTSMASTRIPRQ